MTNFKLKLIAIITMLIDHIGYIFFPEITVFRIIGRIAFPIFCFLIVEGYYHTSDIKKYLIRLGIFAVISEIPYSIVFNRNWNVFITLFLGLLALYLYDKYKQKDIQLSNFIIFIVALSASIIQCDYGEYGILLIFIFYYFRNDFNSIVKYFLGLNILYVFLVFLNVYFQYGVINFNTLLSISLQLFSMLALVFIYFYNGEKGKSFKYIFYLFYPVHLIVLYIIKMI